ncbi:polysaccharide deacetylase family protein [Geomonas sp. RF6]|uniref:polysaccharide deacetylase family protein n=1 Tax=Geomonas sp. RF6 TaxID=2897342 RepID=UPI001E50E660|nr:polysaccharide deacetylase family protein [Geomonas sp. RF6]UFS69129.1 polysaccharide deacetylase family protein [Geomonas sp. RF6]
MHPWLKQALCRVPVAFGVDSAFRYLNRNRLLVVMYHGVTERLFDPPVWTQLPVDSFRRQILFLRDHYRLVSLAEVVAALTSGTPLPERAALITFDDGLKNNFSVAFPIMQDLQVPAGIFLTVDLIGTNEILWFDELYLLITTGWQRGIQLPLPGAEAQRYYRAGKLWEAYVSCAEEYKRAGVKVREMLMTGLRQSVPLDYSEYLADLGLLDWDEVRYMQRSGLVEFGMHTATHRILAEMDDDELHGEIVAPRKRFRETLGHEAEAFCFPNGKPGLDFQERHQEFLPRAGYLCAFTTDSTLYDLSGGNRFGIGRVPAGNDGTSSPDIFRLSTCGAFSLLRSIGRGRLSCSNPGAVGRKAGTPRVEGA